MMSRKCLLNALWMSALLWAGIAWLVITLTTCEVGR